MEFISVHASLKVAMYIYGDHMLIIYYILQCTIGFINDAGREKVECPNGECKQLMCFKCKEPVRNVL